MANIPEDAAPLDKLKNGKFESPEHLESSYKETDVPICRFTKWINMRHVPLPRLPRMYDGFSVRLRYSNNKTSIQ